MNEFYTDYSEYISRFFPGKKIQKISVNIGTGCPNRDGTIGTGGCIYCRNDAFTPSYCLTPTDIASQIEAGKRFFRKKYDSMGFLVYFQSYTGTYRLSSEKLREIYRTAMYAEGVEGLIIGTRPDCLPPDIISMLSELNKEKPIFVELGIETSHDSTLAIINRGHTWRQSEESILKLSEAGLHVGVHLIAGLPGENEDMLMETINQVCRLPVESIKLHHLQVLKGTPLSELIETKKLKILRFDTNEYLDLCVKIIERIPRNIAIERFLASSPPEMVISPKWGLKNYEFTNLLLKKLRTK